MYRYLNQKKICKNKIQFNYDNSSLVQKDISFLIVPKMEHLSKIKKSKYVFHSTLCIGDFEIPRTIIITLKYGDEKALENVLNDEIKKKYIFNELVKIIFSKTILDYHDLKRNKLISPFPQYYSYFSSYEKLAYLTNIKYDYKKYYDYFGDIGKYSSWPEMPYFNDYLSKPIDKQELDRIHYSNEEDDIRDLTVKIDPVYQDITGIFIKYKDSKGKKNPKYLIVLSGTKINIL